VKAIDRKAKTINCRGKLINLDPPLVMGILNLTPDSFYDGAKYLDETAMLQRVEKMLLEGADIIDIGAQSTRPGAPMVKEGDEIKRLIEPLKSVVRHFPEAVISVDTFYSAIARVAVGEGASIINDISAGSFDSNMCDVAGELQVPYVLMHMKGTPSTMQLNPQYDDVMMEMCEFFSGHIKTLESKGVKDIILDPGFGFGKTVEHNMQIISNLDMLEVFGKPILVGLSHKSFTNKLLNTSNINSLNSSVVLNTLCLDRGASIVRVHDVQEAVEAAKIVSFTHLAQV
jgi:dihydropteroate synthase